MGARTASQSGRLAQPGQGIIGMRERAAMLGGELRAAPTEEGGYLVEALLPLGAPDRVGP